MADFKTLLTELSRGKTSLETVRTWIDDVLDESKAKPDDLLAQIDAAGLPQPILETLRTHITERRGQDAEKTAFDFELSLEPVETPAAAAEKTVVTTGRTDVTDKTVVTTGRTDTTEKTVVTTGRQGGDAATVVAGGADEPTVRADQAPAAPAGDYDPFAVDSQTSPSTGQAGTTSWPTGTAWPGKGAAATPKTIGPGTILKDRFELITPLGEGGMGVVYKARDLLKVEAKDKNPYIAVKLLSGDFRNHPEAFIALQRESSKAQRLAHPNIATVYDFDRDGQTVYMTMELLEGQELAKYIKKLPPGGLPVPEAMKIIEQLCAGLMYAHQRGLVHSDFKPGNCFHLNDGTVKIMDFGIARASKTRQDASGETTVFDPGQLGALTPAYATVEMFEGMDPDPRDDIYALAVVAYELLTGKHPFNKLSAVKVLEKGLTPAPINKPGFTKRQWRALQRGLALKRENRTPTVERFWEEIRPKKDYTWHIVGGGLAAALLIGSLAYGPIKRYFEDQRNNALIAQIEQGAITVPEALKQIDTFDERSQRMVLDNAREKIIGHFEAETIALTDRSAGKYGYGAALNLIDGLAKYYPDSAQLKEIQDRLNVQKSQLLNELNDEFNLFLEQGLLLPIENERDITDVLSIIQQIDPKAAQLTDARLATRYAGLAEQDMKSGNFQRAAQILDVSLAYAPQDAVLLDLKDKVTRELKRQADAQLVAEIRQRLAAKRAALAGIDTYTEIKDDLLKLNELRPEDALLADITKALRGVLDAALEQAITAKQWEAAEKLLLDYALLLEVPDLLAKRTALSQAEIAAGYQPASLSDHLTAIDARRNTIRELLAKATFDAEWEAKLMRAFKETVALLRPGNTWFEELRVQIADAHINQAAQLIAANRFDGARLALTNGELFYPGYEKFASSQQRLAEAEAAFEKEQAERLRMARIENTKNSVVTKANANELADAIRALESLRSELAADDVFLRESGPRAIADAALRLANDRVAKDDYAGALTFIRRALEVAPNVKELVEARDRFTALAKRGELYGLASNATPATIRQIPQQLAEARKQTPDEASSIQAEVIKRLAARIKALEGPDVVMANELWEAAKAMFPNERAITSLTLRTPPKPSVFAPRGREAIAKGQLTAASGILAEAQQKEPGHEQVAAFARELEKAKADANSYFTQYLANMRSGNKSVAKTLLEEALKRWGDNPQYLDEMKKNFTTTLAPTRAADGSRPCTSSLAGYGKSGRAECYDMLAGNQKGPTLVVVPAGGGLPAFAIGKYEVSIGEFNAFCRATGKCKPLSGDPELPATNISLDNARAYVAWLAESTGKEYRLPSESEWVYAATAGDANANKDFNCRVAQGDQILKGLTMLAIKAGRPNPWGLINYVGNAQEWVMKGGSVVARGGAYQDPLSSCGIDLVKPSSGSPDALTGFRVARNID
ncbi:MAG TPA: bifunctional serine/threonine-protein kinase/formylglycine-generating enzyme family protein [Gammaproteobacteria bacterium]|nr:bifunctional serine/threonine-protein kinase/formylglycine-generating enzyme family protein [Gammaproteobacteria bacterium]